MEQQSNLARLSEPRYLNVIYSWYEQFTKNHKSRKKLEELENELTWFNGKKSGRNVPDYNGFFNYVYEHYSPQMNTQIEANFRDINDKNFGDYPVIFYYILLYSKKYKVFKDYDTKLKDKDFPKNQSFMLEGFVAYNEWKLLATFLGNFEVILAKVINSINGNDVEHLDDHIEELDMQEIKARFMTAVTKREKKLSNKLYSYMHDLEEGEVNYLSAVKHYAAKEYVQAIECAKKVTKDDIDYGSSIALQLECLAFTGDYESFFACINENQYGQYNRWHLIYLLQMLVSNISDDLTDTFEIANYLDLSKLTFAESNNTYFTGLALQTFAKSLVEGILLLDDYLYAKDMKTSEADLIKSEKRLAKLRLLMNLYPSKIPDFLNQEHVSANTIEDCKKQILGAVLAMLIRDNAEHSFETMYCAFLCEYQLGFIKQFCDNVNSNLTSLIHYYERGEQKAFDLIRLAYVEEALMENVNESLIDFLKTTDYFVSKQDLQINSIINDTDLETFLSDKGMLTMHAAVWEYTKTIGQDNEWKDANLLSLSFFRVLETELNQKLVLPLVKEIGIDDIARSFNGMMDSFKSDEERRIYIKKWGQIINSLKDVFDSSCVTGLSLGSLYQFIRNIGTNYDGHDTLANAFFSPLFSILNDKGFDALTKGEFESLINADKRLLYRCLPSHTQYMNYATACECRDFVNKSLHQLVDWLN